MSATDRSGQGENAPKQRAEWIDEGASADEARVGEARLVKGGARVSTVMEDAPVESVPAGQGRILSEAEIAQSGLLRERVIEIGEMREEAIVSKEAIVREELVVRRDVEERTEKIADTLRRTEVEVEQLEPEEVLESDCAGDARRR